MLTGDYILWNVYLNIQRVESKPIVKATIHSLIFGSMMQSSLSLSLSITPHTRCLCVIFIRSLCACMFGCLGVCVRVQTKLMKKEYKRRLKNEEKKKQWESERERKKKEKNDHLSHQCKELNLIYISFSVKQMVFKFEAREEEKKV